MTRIRRANATNKLNVQVIVHSWDFDGMLASEAYTNKMKELIKQAANEDRSLQMNDYRELAKHVIANYTSFFDQRFKQASPAEHIVFVGSDRQDRKTDNNNGLFKSSKDDVTMTGSCYPFYEALTKELEEHYNVKINLDKLLLEDLYQPNAKPGEIFRDEMNANLSLSPGLINKMAINYDTNGKADTTRDLRTELKNNRKMPEPIAPNYVDHSKFMILYAQMHRTAMDHPDQVVNFRYADDRKDILSKAQGVFLENASLIPPNVTLHLEQFLPTDAEYNKMKKQGIQTTTDDNNRFGDFKQAKIASEFGSQVDNKALENIQRLHNKLSDPSISSESNNIVKTLKQVQSDQLKEKAVRLIAGALNIVTLDSKDVKKMQEIVAGNGSPQEKLEKLQQAAVEHISKQGKLFAKKDSSETQKLYNTLKELDVKNPNISNLEALTTAPKPNLRLE